MLQTNQSTGAVKPLRRIQESHALLWFAVPIWSDFVARLYLRVSWNSTLFARLIILEKKTFQILKNKRGKWIYIFSLLLNKRETIYSASFFFFVRVILRVDSRPRGSAARFREKKKNKTFWLTDAALTRLRETFAETGRWPASLV
jgi:hypothetical protein